GLFVYSLAVAWSQVPSALVRLQWVPPNELATVQGITQAVGAVGQTFAYAAAPFLLAALGGWRGVFLLVGGLLGLFAALWVFCPTWASARPFPRRHGNRARLACGPGHHAPEGTLAAGRRLLRRRRRLLYRPHLPAQLLCPRAGAAPDASRADRQRDAAGRAG